MEVQNRRIQIDNNSSVHLCIKTPDTQPKGCIVFSHGFSVAGFESRRIFWDFSEELTAKGIICVLFDYRGSGYSDLSFSNMTLDTEMEDLESVLDYVNKNIYSGLNLLIWGASFGCGVASLVGAKRKNIGGFILWCLSAELEKRYSKILGLEILEKGYVYLDSGFMVKKAFLDSLKDKDVYKAIGQIESPILFVHGTDDQRADVALSKKAFALAQTSNKHLELIQGGNHGFKCQPEQFAKAAEVTFKWIKKILA